MTIYCWVAYLCHPIYVIVCPIASWFVPRRNINIQYVIVVILGFASLATLMYVAGKARHADFMRLPAWLPLLWTLASCIYVLITCGLLFLRHVSYA